MKDKIKSAFAEIHADQALTEKTAAYLSSEVAKRRRQHKKFVLPKLAGALAFAAVCAVGIFTYSLYSTATAYVSIDVNPSVELTLNRFNKVIDTYAFNTDGERVLSAADLQGKRYDEAAAVLLSYIEAGGYFREGALISVTVRAASGAREQLLCGALQEVINERVLSTQAVAEVEVFPVSADIWSNAHGCHMSPARYLAMQELMAVDEEATMEYCSDSTIRQIRLRAQECRNAHSIAPNENNGAVSPLNGNGHGHWHGCGH